MLEGVEFKKDALDKAAYKARYDELMKRLVVLQQTAVNRGVGLVVLFEGWNGAGKGSRISDLMYNLDARATSVYVSPDIDKDEYRDFAGRKYGVTGFHPLMQEYWEALGERGHITIFDRGWYTKATEMMLAQTRDELVLPKEGTRHYLESIRDFEQQLANDGYQVVKFFVHVRKKAQLKRLNKLYADEATRWRVPEKKLFSVKDYNAQYKLYDRLLEGSNYDFAPWILLDGEDKRATNLQIAETLMEAIERAMVAQGEDAARREADAVRLRVLESEFLEDVERGTGATASAGVRAGAREGADGAVAVGNAVAADAPGSDELSKPTSIAKAMAQHAFAPASSRFEIVKHYPTVESMDYTRTIAQDEYKHELKKLQRELFRLENMMFQARIPLVIMYEGWDAAGKGGNIKRVAQALDARAYTIVPSPAPTKPELAHPHLWRYWTRLPKAGHVGLFDRSWYGRVLVERVEEITPPERWAQGYDEINEFEHDLVDWGAILLKFWVDVSPDEQLARFRARELDPAKQWKITPDDWRNREKYPQYKSAIDDMFRLTSTTYAPWQVLESDDKRYARVKALKIITKALRERLDG